MKGAVACFAEEFAYDDGQYLGVVTNKSEPESRFQVGAVIFPPGAVMVLDQLAVCSTIKNIVWAKCRWC